MVPTIKINQRGLTVDLNEICKRLKQINDIAEFINEFELILKKLFNGDRIQVLITEPKMKYLNPLINLW